MSAPLVKMRDAARAVHAVERRIDLGIGALRTKVARASFPYRAPTIPGHVEVPPQRGRTGADFDTAWARKPWAKAARRVIVRGPIRLTLKTVASPTVTGLDRLADLTRLGDDAPSLIFVANHHSHLDAPLVLSSVPEPWRSKLVVGAASDYFFATRVTGAASALGLGAFPIDRSSVNRRSSDLAAELIGDGWSLVLFPEGGRSPDGWGQPFKGGAAYLAEKCGVAVVPLHIDGAGAIWGKGAKKLRPGHVKVTFGAPLRPAAGENTRRFNERIERAVAELADESIDDWWTARQRAGRQATPTLSGPAYTGWRRQWALADARSRGAAGRRRRQKRRWPSFD
jgi:1-acyl-sn-glycerol-3-phosphate acyltransferase